MPKTKARTPTVLNDFKLHDRRPVKAPALTATQIRAARAALGLTQQDLADRLGVGLRTLAGWETLQQRCCGETCKDVLQAFYALGVIFPTGGAGIEGKFKDGGRRKPHGESVQLIGVGEPWTQTEVEAA